MGESRYNTTPQDIESYQEERKRFLDYSSQFRNGNPFSSLPSLNTLESMYIELVYSIHVKKKDGKAQVFLYDLNTLRDKMTKFMCAQHPAESVKDKEGTPNPRYYLKQPIYQELLADFWSLYIRFKEIKSECGLG